MIKNSSVFKIKDECKLELQTPETMKVFGNTKKVINKSRNGGNVPTLEVTEVVLVQCNLANNQYKQKAEVLYTFTPNKYYYYLLNLGPSNYFKNLER